MKIVIFIALLSLYTVSATFMESKVNLTLNIFNTISEHIHKNNFKITLNKK